MTTRSEPGHGRPDPRLSAITNERHRLINFAYRLLGSLVDAEDVVQETVAFVLHDVFRYPFAEVVGRSPAACRQLASSARRPFEGPERLARVLVDLAGRLGNLTILERTVNGQPGLVAQRDGVTVTVYAFEIAGDRITHIWAVRNPGKLRPWSVSPQHCNVDTADVVGRFDPVEELARARDGKGVAGLVTPPVAIAGRVPPMCVLTNVTER
ncbi:hypothetical protein FE391_06050 [Nonomuraea sp. KC401]|uniref:sigma factor n=1 Tax=unclassified Nonomuraea TaxID=2593643 RepID=UPI0010FD3854|nr:sigma factor [Nonomuraea sp. KC401]NBE92339.1 hypothetical protein [Nonomuraea sp. K271]TLF81856.1 hypothetical protein FE391_06050 [Nonomuraea sp. KC401]